MGQLPVVRAAVVQFNGTGDQPRNLAIAADLISQAVAAGAKVVVLPEKWNIIGEGDVLRAGAESLDGPSITALREVAQRDGIWIVAGSIAELVVADTLLSNTCVVINPDGDLTATYRKIHMFDVTVGGVEYRESDHERAGIDVVDTDIAGIHTGLTICYDLRFPELYRQLASRGVQMVTVPAAFTLVTGQAHWEVLLRARAIENQCFVLAANMVGDHGAGKVSFGHSCIVDPWGTILAEVADGDGIAVADLDFGYLEQVRKTLPSLANRTLS